MAKKSTANTRAAIALRIENRPAADDPNDDPQVPVRGLTVGNNPDGTFTVSSAHHVMTIGMAGTQAKKSRRRGGIVVTGAVVLPKGTLPVSDPGELEDRLKSEVAAARDRGDTAEPHFSLKGLHTLDLGKLSAVTGGSIEAHIHLDADDPDNPKIPVGG